MTGEELFVQYLDTAPAEYSSLLMSIYMAIGDKLFPLLIQAHNTNKKISVRPYIIDDILRDITIDDVVLI